MTTATHTLGWYGLPPHEAETIRWVHEALGDQLADAWRLIENARDDVVIADPQSSQGREALAMVDRPIAVLDRSDQVRHDYRHYVVRPLRPRAIIEALNAAVAEQAGTGSADEAGAGTGSSTPKPLARALHDAANEPDADVVHVIDGLGNEPLVVDGAGDRLRGPVEAVDRARLHDPTPLDVRKMPRLFAAGLAAGTVETARSTHLWRTFCTEADDEPLFGDLERTGVRLVRWPNFSTMRIPRTLFRVATRAHAANSTARRLAEDTGAPIDQVVALCNAAWLTGYLRVTEAARAGASPARGTRGSLANRIRRRLGTG